MEGEVEVRGWLRAIGRAHGVQGWENRRVMHVENAWSRIAQPEIQARET